MLELFSHLFDSDFMPHGHCFFWRPDLVWLHAGSDLTISAAYMIIPLTLVELVRRRRDLVFNWMFIMFGVFIMACGFTHLLGAWNLWQYRRPGAPPCVVIRARRDGRLWRFEVQDNGTGIEAQYREQIFVAFQRLHGGDYPGSGAGLTICKDIVEECGGSIWVESEPGRGSTFVFTVPAADQSNAYRKQTS